MGFRIWMTVPPWRRKAAKKAYQTYADDVFPPKGGLVAKFWTDYQGETAAGGSSFNCRS